MVLYFCIFTGFSYLSPGGDWLSHVMGIKTATDNDPGGPYVISAVELLEHDKALFVGHPGLTLQYFLYGILTSWYHFSNSDSAFSFQAYVARNLDRAFFWSKIGMSLLNLISFALLFYFSSLLFEREIAAIATLLYMTSFPAMLYFSKISPEPLIVIVFVAILIIFYKIHDRSISLNSFSGISAAVCLAFLSMAAIFTKLNLMLATPLIAMCFIVYTGWTTARESRISYFSIIHVPLIFLLSAVGFFFLFSFKINWREFFAYWNGVLRGDYHAHATSKGQLNLIQFISYNTLEMIREYLIHIKIFVTEDLFHHFRTNSRSSLNVITEWSLVVTSIVGACYYIARNRNRLIFWTWPGLFLAINLLFYIVKPVYNYLFLFQVIFSIFAAYGLSGMIDKYLDKSRINRNYLIAIAIIFIHYLSIYSVINSRFDDVKMYRSRCKPYYEAVKKLDHDQKLGVVFAGIKPTIELPLELSWDFVDQRSNIRREVASTYVLIDKNTFSSFESNEEIDAYFKINRIGYIIEAEADGQPIGDYVSTDRWIRNYYER